MSTRGRPGTAPEHTPPPDHMKRLRSLTLSGLETAVGRLPSPLQHLAAYQFGWADETGRPTRDHPGKLIRPLLALLCAQAVGGRPEPGLPAAVGVELVHNFSVVHDDVMDGDETRRHRRTVWAAFGTGNAVLLGDALLALAFRTVSALGHASTTVLSDTLRAMVQGQAEDLAHGTHATAGLSEGLAVAAGKTGALMHCACRVGALSTGARQEQATVLGEFGTHLGLAFQLQDDVLGIWGDPRSTGKPVHSDLRARRRTLPVLAALASTGPAAERLTHLYSRDRALPPGPEQCAELAALIDEAGGRAWAERRVRQAHADALAALERARPEPGAALALLALARSLSDRNH